jgi:hypothetical protein
MNGIITLRKKLLGIQSSLKAPKGQKNKFGNYSYRSAEDILEALKPLLAEHQCCLLCNDSIQSHGNGEHMFNVTTVSLCDCETEHKISVEHAALHSTAKKGMDSAQISGSTASYSLKRALGNLFAIDNEQDADAINKHGRELPDGHGKVAVLRPKEQAMPSQQAVEAIGFCKSINELQALWTNLTDDVRGDRGVITAKDERKKQLTKK